MIYTENLGNIQNNYQESQEKNLKKELNTLKFILCRLNIIIILYSLYNCPLCNIKITC
jgi:hypothetical protein